MKRILQAATAIVLALVLGTTATGCKQKMVRVQTGEIVKCKFGHTVSDTTKTTSVPAKDVAKYGVKTRTIICDRHKVLGQIYAKAQKAIEDGDLKTAEKLLAQVVGSDAAYGQAANQLAKIRAGQKPAPDTGTVDNGQGGNTPGDKPGDENPTGPSMNFERYTPDKISGWTGQTPIADPFVLTRMYLPDSPGEAVQMVIVVEQFKDAASATAQMNGRTKSDYPVGGASIKVNGKPGYYGSREGQALACFTDGALLVSVEMSATTGDAASLKSSVIGVAEAVAK